MNQTEFSSFQTLFIYLYKFHRIKGLGKFKWSQKVMKAFKLWVIFVVLQVEDILIRYPLVKMKIKQRMVSDWLKASVSHLGNPSRSNPMRDTTVKAQQNWLNQLY